MRVHLVSEHASPLALLGGVDAGGQNVHVAALARGLAERGDEVVVHTRRDDPALARRVRYCDGVVVDHVDAGPPEPLSKDALLPYMGQFADDLARSWAEQRPDAVHAHFWMSGLAAVEAADRIGVPVALTYHALGSEKRRHQGAADTSPEGRLDCEPWLSRSVDRVIATTDNERRVLLSMGTPPEQITVIPCGVELSRFRPEGPSWPAANRRVRVVCVSRLVPRKGLADVVQAVAALPDVELLVAGGPPAAMLHEDEHALELEALAARYGAADRIQLLGAVDRRDVPALLRSADVVCCTPWYEPFGLVAVEAMACGVPVVASSVGGLAETVVHGTTGLLVPPHHPEATRAAIEALVRRPELRRAMATTAARRATQYGWDRIAARTHRVLAELAASGHRIAGAPPTEAIACRPAAIDLRTGGTR